MGKRRNITIGKQLQEETLETDLCLHIFTASAAMVGVCLTAIGLFRIVKKLGLVDTIGDDLLAVDALLFLLSCLLSYTALRARAKRRRYTVERVADTVFLLGLVLMALICVLIVYAFL